MTQVTRMGARLKVAFDGHLSLARWGPLFHVLCLEQPGVRLDWRPVGFPLARRPLLDGADVGLFFQPPQRDGLGAVTIETSPMVVVMAVGHRLAQHHELSVRDILDHPFPGGPSLDPEWRAFWTLDEQRGGPPCFVDGPVENAAQGLAAVVSGRAIATAPASVAAGLPHPGVIVISLTDGPPVQTRLVWRSDDESPLVRALVDLAGSMTGRRDGDKAGLRVAKEAARLLRRRD
jgi:DNA-binding transcriptional LysR family regulator